MMRLLFALVFLFPCVVTAQPAIRLILPVSAGSGVDAITRAAAPALGRALNAQMVIENQPGAGGITGTAAIVKAPPDGRTLGMVSNNHVIFPSVYPKLPFDPVADITPISVIGRSPFVLVVNPKFPAKDVKELVALAKANPGGYNYASSGNGTIIHLAGEMFVRQAGIDVKHVPYRGTGPMVSDLLGGQVQMGVVAIVAVQGHLKSGALRAIGVTGRERAGVASEIPTLAEQGLPRYDVDGWFALVGPAGLPSAEVQRVHAAVVSAFASPEVQEAMAKQGNLIRPSTPDAALQYFKSELTKYAEVVKAAGVKID